MAKTLTVMLPDIGEGVVEGEVIAWLKEVGAAVARDEPVVTVMTDKATVELPAPAAGQLAATYCAVGAIALVGKPLYAIAIADEDTAVAATPLTQPLEATAASAVPLQTQAAPTGTATATPATRHLAHELGIPLEAVCGHGPAGRVLPTDLAAYLQSTAAPLATTQETTISQQPGDHSESLSGIRRAMFKKMALSKRTIPHFSYFERADATRLIQLRQHLSAQALQEEGIHLTYMPFFLKALSLTLTRYPQLNSSVDSEKIVMHVHAGHHIGIAMATAAGLIVPVLKHVEKKKLAEIIRGYEELKQRAIKGTLTPEELRGGTITLSNFGVLGGDGVWATPIINPPEVAILALAKIAPLPVAHHGQVIVRHMLPLSWSFDHRLIDGYLAATASRYFAQLLHNPAALL